MYAKVFSSLWDGSMRKQPDKQLVFIYLLCHANSLGTVDIIQGKIADDTGLDESVVRGAILELMGPDERSRTEENEGRALVALSNGRDWGWQIVNYERYRAMRNEEDRKRQNRESQDRFRDKHSSATSKPQSSQAEAEAEAEAEEEPNLCPISSDEEGLIPDLEPLKDPNRVKNRKDWQDGFRQFWEAYPPRPNSSRKDALKVWMTFCPKDYSTADDLFTAIMGALDASSKEWRGREPDKIPHHVVWLRRELWRNDA
jgi:hypothetical protein